MRFGEDRCSGSFCETRYGVAHSLVIYIVNFSVIRHNGITEKNSVVIFKFVKETKYFFRLTVRCYKACKNAVKANAELFYSLVKKSIFIGKSPQ